MKSFDVFDRDVGATLLTVARGLRIFFGTSSEYAVQPPTKFFHPMFMLTARAICGSRFSIDVSSPVDVSKVRL